MPRIDRNQLLERFREMIARKETIIGGGARSMERAPGRDRADRAGACILEDRIPSLVMTIPLNPLIREYER